MTIEDAILVLDGIHDCCECVGDEDAAERLEAVQMAKEALRMQEKYETQWLDEGCRTCRFANVCDKEVCGYFELESDLKHYYTCIPPSMVEKFTAPIIDDLVSRMSCREYSAQQIRDILYDCIVAGQTNGKR